MCRFFRVTTVFLTSCVCAVLFVGCAQNGKTQSEISSKAQDKIKITKLDDLPQHTYPVSGKVSDLVRSREGVLELAKKVRADIESDLATYEINDATTLKRMQGTLVSIDLVEGKYDEALKRIKRIRGLETKEAEKLTVGLSTQTIIAAKREVGGSPRDAAYHQAVHRELSKKLAALPWDVVEDSIQQSKGMLEIRSENLLMGLVEGRMDPVVAKTGELNADQAARVIDLFFTLTERMPLRDTLIAAYQELIDANKTVKPDIWAARSVTFRPDEKLSPVLIAAWDSGTDPDVFTDILFVNLNEKADGTDTDGNGFVDDVHGIAYDIHAKRTTGLLYPPGEAAGRIPDVMKYLTGLMDLQAAIDSKEATTLKRHIAGLERSAVNGFIEDISLAGNYAHGTHVAGIMTEGNPFARLLIARLSYDHRTIPVARTVEWGERDAAKCRETVEYFKHHGVRVVNMSWGEAQDDAEQSLERNGIGKSAEERRDIAREVFKLQKAGLYEAIKNAPDILFVCAAGNADNDVQFDEYIPSSFELPNLLTVGAVDQAGDPTSFTSFGKMVRVYANGFEVLSFVPGGAKMKMSGTSMASPNAANLAAKLLSIAPSLTPAEVITLIEDAADKQTHGDSSFLLINPRKTVERLRHG